MAHRNLTFEKFWSLSEQDRIEWASELSEDDQYKLRMTMPPAATLPPCNRCVYYHRGPQYPIKPSCDAFSQGLTAEAIEKVEADPTIECSPGYRFTPDRTHGEE